MQEEELTIEQHLLALPGEYRDRALANLYKADSKRKHLKAATETTTSVAYAVYLGFTWCETPEGSSFWSKMNNILDYDDYKVEDFPEIPKVPIAEY